MTRYDPFSYGQVSPSKVGKPGPTPADAEDLLFAEPVAAKAPADSSWALLNEDVDNLLPGATASPPEASEVWREDSPALSTTTGKRPATGVRPAASTTGAPPPRPLSPSRAEGPRGPKPITPPLAVPEIMIATPVVPARAEPRPSTVLSLRRQRPLSAIVVPSLLCAGGGTAAAWLHFSVQNPVLAAIAGASTLVASAFAWLFLRG